jgi:hypothetical protein
VHDDDMTGLLEQVYSADILLFSTPLYCFTMSAAMKVFLERLLPITRPYLIRGSHGQIRNALRNPDAWGHKKLAVISAAAFDAPGNFDGLVTTFRLLADGMSMAFAGALYRPESFLLQFHLSKPKTSKKIENALVRAGIELVKEGTISHETVNNAAASLTTESGYFQKYSNIYWEYISALGLSGDRMLEARDHVLGDPRILVYEMTRNLDTRSTAAVRAVLQFNFPDKNRCFCVTINRGTCSIEEKQCGAFDLKVTTDSETWRNAFQRKISFKDALLDKKILLEGDKTLFLRLERLFPLPNS